MTTILADAIGPEVGKASPWGLLILLVFLVAVALLIRSMNARLKQMNKNIADGTFAGQDPQRTDSSDNAPANKP